MQLWFCPQYIVSPTNRQVHCTVYPDNASQVEIWYITQWGSAQTADQLLQQNIILNIISGILLVYN